jgi:hypothetical protein
MITPSQKPTQASRQQGKTTRLHYFGEQTNSSERQWQAGRLSPANGQMPSHLSAHCFLEYLRVFQQFREDLLAVAA